MRFMMLVKANKDSEAGMPPPPKLMAAVGKLAEEGAKSGALIDTGGLLPSSQGARVRVSGGKVNVVDGPFTETKEIVGGYAVMEAGSRQEAIEHARRFMQLHADVLGSAYEGECEVRQIFGPTDLPKGK